MRTLAGLLLVVLVGCVGGVDAPEDDGVSEMYAYAGTLSGVQITSYTLVSEASTSGQHSGDTSIICDPNGVTGCFHREFLCSGWGIPMQGTGVALDGRLIKWRSGGGGWTGGYSWLANCAGAQFGEVSEVYGSTGRTLIPSYSIAVDPAVIPYGWSVWIETERQWYRADDTGGAIDGRHIDIYTGANGNAPVAGWSKVYITSKAHPAGDPSPFDGSASRVDDSGAAEPVCTPAVVAGASGTFQDIPDGSWYEPYAEALYQAGITAGCQESPRLFCPNCPMDRAVLATFVARSLGLAPITPSTFADVPSTAWYAGYVEALRQAGITSGCGDNNFCPDKLATRWETAALAFRAMGIPEATPSGIYTDVSASQAPILEALSQACVLSGCAANMFCPDRIVTRAEAAKIMAVSFSVPPFSPCAAGSN